MALHVDRALPPMPTERGGDWIPKDSEVPASSQRTTPFDRVSRTSPRGENSGIFGSSHARPHSEPPSKSVHWSRRDSFIFSSDSADSLDSPDSLDSADSLDSLNSLDTTVAKRRRRAGSAGVKTTEDVPRSKTPSLLPHGPPRYPMAKEIEESSKKPPIRRVDGFCYAGDAKDVTVQLSLELRDDLTDEVEQLRLLIQLGRFQAAKKHFEKHLESHAYHPYVRAEYADMLFQQGDYNSLVQFVAQPWGGHSQDDVHLGDRDEHTGADKCQALHQYWSALRAYTFAVHDIAQLPEIDRSNLHAAVRALNLALRHPDKVISPIQIRILGLLIDLHGEFPLAFISRDLNITSFVHRLGSFEGWGDFYEGLLTQGRIWDFRHLLRGLGFTAGHENALSSFLGMPTSSMTELTKRLIADWTGVLPEDNLFTKLALLSVSTLVPRMDISLRISAVRPDTDCLDEFTPLAHSVLLHHPEALRTRPYLEWILCRVLHASIQGRPHQENLADLLSTSPGVFVHGKYLPMYIPRRDENPGWKALSARPEFRDALRMALRIAREIGDCSIQADALASLISISNDPADLFEELGTLLKLLGDNIGYTCLLVTKYLVSTTPELQNKLKQEVATLLSEPALLRTMHPDITWMIKMLYVKLEGSDSLLSRGPLDDARSLQAERRLSNELQRRIATSSNFAIEGIQHRSVDAETRESELQPYTNMGRQASQRPSSDRQFTTPRAMYLPAPSRNPVYKGFEAFPDNSTKPPESLHPRDRLRQRQALDILPAPPYAGSNEPRKSKMQWGEGRAPSPYQRHERDGEAPTSSRTLNNRPQEPSPIKPIRLGTQEANAYFEEEQLSPKLSMLREKQRSAAEDGDEDRSKTLADNCSGIERELSITRGNGPGKHPTNPPFDNKESERPGSVPTDGRSEPSAGGAPPPVRPPSPSASVEFPPPITAPGRSSAGRDAGAPR